MAAKSLYKTYEMLSLISTGTYVHYILQM